MFVREKFLIEAQSMGAGKEGWARIFTAFTFRRRSLWLVHGGNVTVLLWLDMFDVS